MNNRKRAAGFVFLVIGLVWMILSFSRPTGRSTYLILGVVFLIIGLALNVGSRKSAG